MEIFLKCPGSRPEVVPAGQRPAGRLYWNRAVFRDGDAAPHPSRILPYVAVQHQRSRGVGRCAVVVIRASAARQNAHVTAAGSPVI